MKKVLLIIISILFINIDIVKASEITLDDIKNSLNNEFNIEAKVSNNELIINDLVFNLENNILSRTNTYKKNTLDSVNDLYIYLNLTKNIALLKGYQEKEIEYFLKDFEDVNMINDGYELVKERDNDNIKITYKIDLNNFNIKMNYIEADKPELKVINTNNNQVKLSLSYEGKADIDLYYSIDNENFKYINTLSINNSVINYIDSDLEQGKTYYYKAVVKKANNYSDTVEVSIPREKIEIAYADEKTSNPLTGYKEFVAVAFLVMIAVISVINVINLKKKVYR